MKTTGLYTVATVASLTGISIRTLHHYDECGLLRPTARSDAGYRLYSFDDLLRLQQILLYRAMHIPLDTIAELLTSGQQDIIHALGQHRQTIEREMVRLQTVHDTITATIQSLEDMTMPTDERSLYDGLDGATIEAYQREAEERFDKASVEESRRNTLRMTKGDWQKSKQQWEELLRDYAAAMDKGAASVAVQEIVERHRTWLTAYWTPKAESFEGLGELYATHSDFVERIDAVRPGLASFIRTAMTVFARTTMRLE
jgi:DNA-binding transcriptional MerR regulator